VTAATDTIAMSLAQDIRREHEAAQQAFASAVEHAVRCGELLAEAKAQVRHGAWLPWLAENFPASVRTAQGYMRLAAQPDTQGLAHLGIEGALRQLAVPPAVNLDEAADRRPLDDARRILEDLEDLKLDEAEERRLVDDVLRRLEDVRSPEECFAILEEARGHVARLEGVVARIEGLRGRYRRQLRDAMLPIADMLVAELLALDSEKFADMTGTSASIYASART